MSPNRISAARALLDRSRVALASFESGRRLGVTLTTAPGILPEKPASALDGAARPAFVQSHGGK